jgi:hypothetical protein
MAGGTCSGPGPTTSRPAKSFDDTRAERDLNAAQQNADRADAAAGVAIEFAYATVEEAEYAVLRAILVRMNADELAAGAQP